MTLTSAPRTLRVTAGVAASLAGLVFILGACSSGSGDAADTLVADGFASDTDPGGAPEPAADEAPVSDGQVVETADGRQQASVAERSVISTATVALSSKDVAGARFDVQKVVDRFNGEVAEEETEGGEEMQRSRVVIRIPSKEFSAAIEALEEIGVLESSSRTSEDVTTTVIDNAARIRAQEASLKRVELLLSRAVSISDIVAIEAQLTQRQADLDSLKSQQAFLADQTSLSTIRVLIERTSQAKEEPDTDDAGFFSGLRDGWDALRSFGTDVATVAGTLLPFAVLVGLLGVPAWVLSRRAGRRGSPADPVPTGP